MSRHIARHEKRARGAHARPRGTRDAVDEGERARVRANGVVSARARGGGAGGGGRRDDARGTASGTPERVRGARGER